MTLERAQILEAAGFVWDLQGSAWNERLEELKQFKLENGHVNVTHSEKFPKLSTWLKCNRRQYKLFHLGQPSNITPERIRLLDELGLRWEMRGAKRRMS